jgi:acyl carrier protein
MAEHPMDTHDVLRNQIKQLMVENLMLRISADQIQDEQPLFGPEGLGLDSVDALQLVVSLDKQYGLKIADADTAREVLRSVRTMAEAVVRHQAASGGA